MCTIAFSWNQSVSSLQYVHIIPQYHIIFQEYKITRICWLGFEISALLYFAYCISLNHRQAGKFITHKTLYTPPPLFGCATAAHHEYTLCTFLLPQSVHIFIYRIVLAIIVEVLKFLRGKNCE